MCLAKNTIPFHPDIWVLPSLLSLVPCIHSFLCGKYCTAVLKLAQVHELLLARNMSVSGQSTDSVTLEIINGRDTCIFPIVEMSSNQVCLRLLKVSLLQKCPESNAELTKSGTPMLDPRSFRKSHGPFVFDSYAVRMLRLPPSLLHTFQETSAPTYAQALPHRVPKIAHMSRIAHASFVRNIFIIVHKSICRLIR